MFSKKLELYFSIIIKFLSFNRMSLPDNAIEQNLYYLERVKFYYSLMFVYPVLVLYYETKGVSVDDFFVIQPIFTLTAFLFEVPLGYLSDRWQRRMMIISGMSFFGIGVLFAFVGNGPIGLSLTAFFLGLGFAFSTSPFDAILRATLTDLGRGDDYEQEAKFLALSSSKGLGLSALFSGGLYYLNLEAPVVFQLAAMVFCILFAFKLREPVCQKLCDTSFWQVVKKTSIQHVDLKWVMLFGGVLSAVSTKATWLIQPIVHEHGWEWIIFIVGLLLAVAHVIIGKAPFWFDNFFKKSKKFKKPSRKKTLIMMLGVSSLGYILSGLAGEMFMLLGLILVFMAFGITQINIKAAIADRTPVSIAATAKAIHSSIVNLVFTIITPIFGWAMGYIDTQFALYLLSGIMLVIGIPVWFLIKEKSTVLKLD